MTKMTGALLLVVSLSASAPQAQVTLVKKSFVYKEAGSTRVELDLYRREGQEVLPVLVWIHGGALIMGSRAGVPKNLLELCRVENFALISLDYRLAPESKLPEIISDVKDAFKWIRGPGAEEAQINPKRLVVAGGSAGGYLTLMTGLCVDPRPSALVAYYGYGDVDGDWYCTPSKFYREERALVTPEEAKRAVGPVPITSPATKEQAEARGKYYLYLRQNGLWTKEVTGFDPREERAKLDPYCPVRNVSPSFPPTMLLHGTADTDVPYELSAAMAREFERHKVAYELVTLEGAGHGLTGGDRNAVAEAHSRAMAFIKNHLR